MRRFVRVSSAFVSFLAVSASVSAGERQFGPTDNLVEAEGVELVREYCLACHDDSYIISMNVSREAWDDTLVLMLGMGMPPLDPEVHEKVLDYLEETQGDASSEEGTDSGEPGGAPAAADFASPWATPVYHPNPLDWNRPRGR